MKAISVWPEWAMPIMLGQKTVERRSWETRYRGKLLICASNKPLAGYVHGRALCVVDLIDVVPFGYEHVFPSMTFVSNGEDLPRGEYAWVLDNVRMAEPVPVKGKQMLFDVPDDLVKVLGKPSRRLVEKHIIPIAHRSNSDAARILWAETFQGLRW